MALFGKAPELPSVQLPSYVSRVDDSSRDPWQPSGASELGGLFGKLIGEGMDNRTFQKLLGTKSKFDFTDNKEFARYLVDKGERSFKKYLSRVGKDQIDKLKKEGITDYKSYAEALVKTPNLIEKIAPSLHSNVLGTAYSLINDVEGSKYIGETLMYDNISGGFDFYNPGAASDKKVNSLNPRAANTSLDVLSGVILNPNSGGAPGLVDTYNQKYGNEWSGAKDYKKNMFTMNSDLFGSNTPGTDDDLFSITNIDSGMISNGKVNLNTTKGGKFYVNPEGMIGKGTINYDSPVDDWLKENIGDPVSKWWKENIGKGGLDKPAFTSDLKPMGTIAKERKEAADAKRAESFAINQSNKALFDKKLAAREKNRKANMKPNYIEQAILNAPETIGKGLKGVEKFLGEASGKFDQGVKDFAGDVGGIFKDAASAAKKSGADIEEALTGLWNDIQAKKKYRADYNKLGKSSYGIMRKDGTVGPAEGQEWVDSLLSKIEVTGSLGPSNNLTMQNIDFFLDQGWLTPETEDILRRNLGYRRDPRKRDGTTRSNFIYDAGNEDIGVGTTYIVPKTGYEGGALRKYNE